MSMPEQLPPQCPPDAHKVMREPENNVKALLCICVPDSELDNGEGQVMDIISRMGKKPLILCSDKVREVIDKRAHDFEIEPDYLEVHADQQHASIHYADKSISETFDYVQLGFADPKYKEYLELLQQKIVIGLDMMTMFIARSISTVLPWDKLLANTFLSQYLKAAPQVTEEDKKLLGDIRYDRVNSFDVFDDKEHRSESAYQYLRLERKLFLQYPTEDEQH
ncbi:MAG: hypothetical protein K6F05_01010 [Succinivibrio sp.]|nr:hypothetical protein [Succinivibrio sp.]